VAVERAVKEGGEGLDGTVVDVAVSDPSAGCWFEDVSGDVMLGNSSKPSVDRYLRGATG